VVGGELKTKPTQHSVKALREIGIQPDILLCRAPYLLEDAMRKKIALFTNVEEEAVISAYDIKTSIYEIPLMYHGQCLDKIVVEGLGIEDGKADLEAWKDVVNTYNQAEQVVRVALVGKYVELNDTYKSIHEALIHGGLANKVRTEIVYIDSEKLEKEADRESRFEGIDGILVPGGFGQRGIEGMVSVAELARTKKIPYFGICLGLQVMVIEYARNVLGLEYANSTEFAPEGPHPVISLLEEQIDVIAYGGTMRLGKSETKLLPNTTIQKAYGTESVYERHRHRYEVSNLYRDSLYGAGLVIGGVTPDNALVESVEWPDHPWGIGVQYHPEFRSRPTDPHPLFVSFIQAGLQK
jgi:CTP synthase